MLKSTPSTLTYTRNTPVELLRRYHREKFHQGALTITIFLWGGGGGGDFYDIKLVRMFTI